MKIYLLVRIAFFSALICGFFDANAQMARQRVAADGPVDATFKAPKLIQLATTKNFDANTLNFTIMHSFGRVNGGYEELWGLDGAANIRFGLDYGISKDWSVGVGRSRVDKLYDFRTKYVLFEQLRSGKIPVTVAIQSTVARKTLQDPLNTGLTSVRRWNYSHLLMVSRKINERFSVQLTPLVSHFNFVKFGDPNTVYALGLSGRAKLNARVSLTGEYIPILSERPAGAKDGVNLGLELETGGHVFQMFFTNSTGLTESYAVSRNSEGFFGSPAGAFRFGFNVHRIFWF